MHLKMFYFIKKNFVFYLLKTVTLNLLGLFLYEYILY